VRRNQEEFSVQTTPIRGSFDIAWSPDGKRLAAVANDRIMIWRSGEWREEMAFAGHSGEVWTIDWSPDGKWLASGGKDTTVRMWSTDTGGEVWKLGRHTEGVWVVRWSPDGKRLASTGNNGTVCVWNKSTESDETRLQCTNGYIDCLVWSPNGEHLMAAYSYQAGEESKARFRIWEASTWKQVLTDQIPLAHEPQWNPTGEFLAWVADGISKPYHPVKLWSASSRRQMRVDALGDYCDELAWSPDRRRLAVLGILELPVWDRITGQVAVLPTPRGLAAPTWSAKGRFLAVGDLDGHIRLWYLEPGRRIAPW
jgi:WD40 repeat protein